MQNILEMIIDALIDNTRLLPFLFFTYLAMEYMEHRMGGKTKEAVGRAGRFGPLLGAACGIFPQCGFSAAASDLFAGGIITMGTLLAVFLSTSDEMLPILLSEQVKISVILKLLGMKALIGMAAGFLVDLVICTRKETGRDGCPGTEGTASDSHPAGTQEECHCEEGIFWPAVRHTGHVFAFIFIFSIVLNLVIGMAGEDFFSNVLLGRPAAGALVGGLIGLVPNCAASVALTQLYLDGLIGFGTMMSGLLVGSGIGLLVLFRVNDNVRESAAVTGLLYGFGVAAGMLLDLFGIAV